MLPLDLHLLIKDFRVTNTCDGKLEPLAVLDDITCPAHDRFKHRALVASAQLARLLNIELKDVLHSFTVHLKFKFYFINSKKNRQTLKGFWGFGVLGF